MPITSLSALGVRVVVPSLSGSNFCQNPFDGGVRYVRPFPFLRRSSVEDGETWYVAWFEPAHHVVELNASFFRDRFASMKWSILTPDRRAHWDGSSLQFSPGLTRAEAPSEDAVEPLWQRYYASIFNPARVKTHAMQRKLPRRHWKNLPEAQLIPNLCVKLLTAWKPCSPAAKPKVNPRLASRFTGVRWRSA